MIEGDVRYGTVSLRYTADTARSWSHSARVFRRHYVLHHTAVATTQISSGTTNTVQFIKVWLHVQ